MAKSLILLPLRLRCVRFGQPLNEKRPVDILLSLSSSCKDKIKHVNVMNSDSTQWAAITKSNINNNKAAAIL